MSKVTKTELAAESSAPVDVNARIRELDALRGIALLGIVWANVRQIFWPWEIAGFSLPLGGNDRLAWLDWQIFDALIDLKFLTLFSLLFGVGFALQSERLTARGHGFRGIYIRRVLILALFGILHGLLLYPAEVLTPYAFAGLLLLAAKTLSIDNLFRIGLILLGTTVIWHYQIGSLGDISIVITALTIAALSLSLALLWRKNWRIALAVWIGIVLAAGLILTLRFNFSAGGENAASEYREAQKQLLVIRTNDPSVWPEEFRVRRLGDFRSLVALHASQYAMILFYFAVLLLWRTLGLFMIGAGLFRSGALTINSPRRWNRVASIGLTLGLPLSVLATWVQGREIQGLTDWRFPEFLHTVSALPLAAGIAGIVFVLHRRNALRALWAPVEAAGRMALTNYIAQSFLLAAIAEPWGLNLYARLSGPALTALALIAFTSLAFLSQAWLTRFRMGPLEWLWRCGTYWRRLPLSLHKL